MFLPPSRVVDQPEPGFFLIRLCKGGPKIPARITRDFSLWSASIMGASCGASHEDPLKAAGISRIWSYGEMIDLAEYQSRLARPPQVDPKMPVDLSSLPALY